MAFAKPREDSDQPGHLLSLMRVFAIMFVVSWPQGSKTFSCSTQLSMKFILLINVKMPTIVGISTFMSRINVWL